MAKLEEYHQNQIMLMPPSLEEKVPEGRLARYISTLVDDVNTHGQARAYLRQIL